MTRSCCLAVSVLLAIAATASATLPPLMHEEHLEEATATATGLLAAEGARVASTWAANKVSAPQPLEARPSGGMATQGDDQSSSSGSNSSGEHSKEEGGSKEGEKQGKSCLTKEECHKKKMLCGKGCTLSAHSKCAAKCTKSCVPTC